MLRNEQLTGSAISTLRRTDFLDQFEWPKSTPLAFDVPEPQPFSSLAIGTSCKTAPFACTHGPDRGDRPGPPTASLYRGWIAK
jgi:hypothetical protein